MIRTVLYCEKNTQVDPPRVVTVAAATATLIFADSRRSKVEYSQRYFQNTGSNPLYYSFGVLDANGNPVCNNVAMYHGYVPAGEQLDCSAHRQCVCVYSVAGTTVSTTVVQRLDDTRHN